MSNNKKYFWLKLKEDFFRNKKIKKLRKIAGGDTYALIYLEMQLLSLKNNGILIYENVEDTFAEEIALEIDEDAENVKVTLLFLLNNGLLEEIKENEYVMTETIECIGSETASAERVRKYRALKAQREKEALEEKEKALLCNTPVTTCNTEKSREELDLDKNRVIVEEENKEEEIFPSSAPTSPEKNLFNFLESNFGRTIAPIEWEQIQSWQNDFNDEIIEYAITLSCNANAKNINYVNAILNNWKSKGFTKIAECKNENANRKQNNSYNNSNSKPIREEVIPSWFGKDNEIEETTEAEKRELSELLKDYQNP